MSSGFVSEKVLEEKRQERQAEWEKVRKPEEPALAPEVPQDNRSLFEQLQANRSKVQDEWDEAHKLKNQIRGIDDDEAEFLDNVDNVRESVERQRRMEERKELEMYRLGQAELMDKELEERTARIRTEGMGPSVAAAGQSGSRKRSGDSLSSSSSSQAKLLMAAVKKKPAPSAAAAPVVTVASKDDKEKTEEGEVSKSSLGALAGLGDYDSTTEEEEEEDEER